MENFLLQKVLLHPIKSKELCEHKKGVACIVLIEALQHIACKFYGTGVPSIGPRHCTIGGKAGRYI